MNDELSDIPSGYLLPVPDFARSQPLSAETFWLQFQGAEMLRSDKQMKRQIVHTLQKYLLNPPIKLALGMGLPLPGYALLETTGRRTAKTRRTPVGNGRIGNHFWLVAEHGMKAGYVRNIENNPRVRLKLREGLKYYWHRGTAHLLLDDDPRERQRWLAKNLPSSVGNSRAVRLFGTQLLTIRIDLDSYRYP